jgi:hypothetical protein
VTDQELSLAESLAHIGIAIAPRAQSGWGWSIENDKIVRDDRESYPTPAAAAGAALEWLLEYARKGLLCHHVHAEPVDDDPLAPWLRAFEQGIVPVSE